MAAVHLLDIRDNASRSLVGQRADDKNEDCRHDRENAALRQTRKAECHVVCCR